MTRPEVFDAEGAFITEKLAEVRAGIIKDREERDARHAQMMTQFNEDMARHEQFMARHEEFLASGPLGYVGQPRQPQTVSLTQQLTTEKTVLYRLFSADDQLLYIGIARDPAARQQQHAGDKSWYPLVARKEFTEYPTRQDAVNAERAAIVIEGPLHNVIHSALPRQADAS